MRILGKQFQIDFKGKANDDAMIIGNTYRFTVLTPGLIRMEYDPTGEFEDRPSQLFWYRQQKVPAFSCQESSEMLKIGTEYLELEYLIDKQDDNQGFSSDNLRIKVKDTEYSWRYGEKDRGNLLGTVRTLDSTDGKIELEKGLLSRDGWVVIDDSDSLVFNENYWVERRENNKEKKDIYFFAYGHDYLKCFQDFLLLSGKVPLIPRWALGNWWSRYWAYSDQELRELMTEFKERKIPLTVCIIDMDWHLVENEYTDGWTGFSWNQKLFPEPDKFIKWLHQRKLKTALNIHPHAGVYPHENKYQELTDFMGGKNRSGEAVEFDLADPLFIQGYFDILLHPLEERDGVDFWWIDWQQGKESYLKGLDPLWALNHLHFFDRARDKTKRPFVFSRWAGLGNHRYPIGFSGDTIVSWESLAIQPEFTARASNVQYGWWSHDIGGHYFGVEDAELYTRWVQYGLFSPILRLHSTNDPYQERRPWAFGEEVERICSTALRWRKAFIPYIYTMAWRHHQEGIPLINPLYYHYPESEQAYCFNEQYFFGSELLVAPFITPRDSETNLSRKVVWLPAGNWFNFFGGQFYQGDNIYIEYGQLSDIPVYAREGAIIPLDQARTLNGADNPQQLEVRVFPGASNSFTLYEDDGWSQDYTRGKHAQTLFQQSWQRDTLEFIIFPAEGDLTLIPEERDYKIVFMATAAETIKLWVNNRHLIADNSSCNNLFIEKNKDKVEITLKRIKVKDKVKVKISNSSGRLMSISDHTLGGCRKLLKSFRLPIAFKQQIEQDIVDWYKPGRKGEMSFLNKYTAIMSNQQIEALLATLAGVGAELIRGIRDNELIVWNNLQDESYKYLLTLWEKNLVTSRQGKVDKFLSVLKSKEIKDFSWNLRISCAKYVQLELDDKK